MDFHEVDMAEVERALMANGLSHEWGAILWELEQLKARAMCGCGDFFTEHDPGTCGNCLAAMNAGLLA